MPETGEELADNEVYEVEDSVHWRRRIQSGDVKEITAKDDAAAEEAEAKRKAEERAEAEAKRKAEEEAAAEAKRKIEEEAAKKAAAKSGGKKK